MESTSLLHPKPRHSALPIVTAPLVIAHRGLGTRPPNTLHALQGALDEGAQGLAIDVSETRDGVWVAAEDRLVRALGLAARVADLTWDELSRVDLGPTFGSREVTIPRVDEVLSRFSGMPMVLLLPESATARAFPSWSGAAIDVWLVAPDDIALRSVTRSNPAALRLLRGLSGPRGGLTVDGWVEPVLGFQRNPVVGRALRVGLDGNTGYSCAMAVELGLDALLTERPGWALERLQRVRTSMRTAPSDRNAGDRSPIGTAESDARELDPNPQRSRAR